MFFMFFSRVWGIFLGCFLGFLLLVTWDDLVCLFVVCFGRVNLLLRTSGLSSGPFRLLGN